MSEVWKDIKGFEGLYQVSNMGRVKSTQYYHGTYERILKPFNNKGYLRVLLFKNGNFKSYLVHRLVAQAFIPNPYNLPQVNHKDENPSNNHVDNLEWCSCKYNCNYGVRNELIANKKNKTVYQYTLDGKFIAEYPSAAEVQRQLGYSQGNISQCRNGKRKTAYGYIWRYTD